ncbi:hypothetical protein GCM10011494_35980 [Novosphingobium endophyticum]|uniref:Uncharacterized protein n=1 Tax=Novosphingobium endophyticum TaxID=1955250 RepID=A0A916X735_9SPHN|nr:hypothetical protein GCM10011494_35980 [Novosphingobium endophyticum]
MDGALAPGWRFAAHLGVSSSDAPLLAATAGSIDPVDQIACAAAAGFAGISDNGLKRQPPDVQRRMGKALRDHGLAMGSFTYAMPGREPPFFWGSPIPDVSAALHETLAAGERVEGGLINVILLDSGAPLGSRSRVRDRRPANARIHPVEIRRQHLKRFIDNRTDCPKRMVCRNPRLAAHVGKQPLAPVVSAAHPVPSNIAEGVLNHFGRLK